MTGSFPLPGSVTPWLYQVTGLHSGMFNGSPLSRFNPSYNLSVCWGKGKNSSYWLTIAFFFVDGKKKKNAAYSSVCADMT